MKIKVEEVVVTEDSVSNSFIIVVAVVLEDTTSIFRSKHTSNKKAIESVLKGTYIVDKSVNKHTKKVINQLKMPNQKKQQMKK